MTCPHKSECAFHAWFPLRGLLVHPYYALFRGFGISFRQRDHEESFPVCGSDILSIQAKVGREQNLALKLTVVYLQLAATQAIAMIFLRLYSLSGNRQSAVVGRQF